MIDLPKEHILLNQSYENAHEAIIAVGELLNQLGLTTPQYTQAMLKRQQKVSVYIGNFVALPHGDNQLNQAILKEGICFIQVPDGVNFGNEAIPQIATLLIGVAVKENQLEFLQDIAFHCSDLTKVMKLSDAQTEIKIQELLLD